MSLFTVVGMIGMVGIIINDSIVLVTTIDEYSETRGLIPAIIDGTSDRLRPVFLTTATTVLGLAPLLYEGSNQAEFLKPTVVTLVYGLGFGMVLVLMVVPALMAMQDDWARQVGAARRALRASGDGALPARLSSSVSAFVSMVLFAALILPVVVTGAPWPALAEQLPFLAGGFGPALAAFAAVLAVVLVVIYAITGLLGRKRPKPA
jgi:predicted RND superfamily exporter protein